MYVPLRPSGAAGATAGGLRVHARVLVRVAEDELARRERAPAPPFAARRRRAPVVVGALDGGLGEAVGVAEVLARALEQLGVLLVDDLMPPAASIAARILPSARLWSTVPGR